MTSIAEGLANLVVNVMFDYAPFQRAQTKPIVRILDEALMVEDNYVRGVKIEVVAVATITVEKAYVISSKTNRARGDTFQIRTENDLVPNDLFLGWGLMSSPFSSRMFSYETVYKNDGSRSMYSWSDERKISRARGNCAHVHMMNRIDFKVPSKGQCVSFEGYLVDIYIDDVRTWATDLTIGDENCETIYPTQFKILS